MAGVRKRVKKKKDIKLTSGVLHVQTTKNNTIVCLTDDQGNKVFGGGTGMLGFKWAKKNTPYAAEVLTKQIMQDAHNAGLKTIAVVFRGVGMSRDGIFKAINEIGVVDISYIQENTPIQFGWCKWKRPKRN